MLVYKKKKSTIHLHVIPVMKCGCVFWEFAKRKLATRKDKIKIKIINTKRDGYASKHSHLSSRLTDNASGKQVA
jgi:hypothetical protein